MGFSLTSPRFGFIPEVNLAPQYLKRAMEFEERGDLVAAGVYLREAVHRQLVSMCHWFDCWPQELNHQRSNKSLVKALRRPKAIDGDGEEMFCEMIDVGNAAAHCQPFSRGTLRGCMSIMHCVFDDDPCISRERVEHPQPVNEWDTYGDDDDDDAADFWKAGAV